MKAKITEKINTKSTQMVWENQVLYLQIKEYANGNKAYVINDVPEGDNDFCIPVPLGRLNIGFGTENLKKTLDDNRNLINLNIEYLNNIHEILNYIEKLNDESSSVIK